MRTLCTAASKSRASSKSQIRTTVQPASASWRLTRSSRVRFARIFSSHFRGSRPGVQREGCPCHHAESTKTATRLPCQQISGVPGTERTWHLHPRTPAAQSARRSRSSTLVSFDRTRLMIRLRVSLSTTSVTTGDLRKLQAHLFIGVFERRRVADPFLHQGPDFGLGKAHHRLTQFQPLDLLVRQPV